LPWWAGSKRPGGLPGPDTNHAGAPAPRPV
jgi:hypothetical protein